MGRTPWLHKRTLLVRAAQEEPAQAPLPPPNPPRPPGLYLPTGAARGGRWAAAPPRWAQWEHSVAPDGSTANHFTLRSAASQLFVSSPRAVSITTFSVLRCLRLPVAGMRLAGTAMWNRWPGQDMALPCAMACAGCHRSPSVCSQPHEPAAAPPGVPMSLGTPADRRVRARALFPHHSRRNYLETLK